MTTRTATNNRLSNILGGMSNDTFFEQYWDRRPFHCDRKDVAFYGDCLSIEVIDHIITGTELRVPSLRIVKDGEELPPKMFSRPKTYRGTQVSVIHPDLVYEAYHAGATVIFPSLDSHHYPVAEMCLDISKEVGGRCQANAYLTPPSESGFSPHWDNHNILVLQISGSKKWRIWKDAAKELPLLSDSCVTDAMNLTGDVENVELLQGDCLYIPRGIVHAAEAAAAPSLHLSVSMSVRTGGDLLKRIIDLLQSENVELRRSVFVERMTNADLEKLVNGMLSRLKEKDVSRIREKVKSLDGPMESVSVARGLFAASEYATRIQRDTLVRPIAEELDTRIANGALEVSRGSRWVRFPPEISKELETIISNRQALSAVTLPVDYSITERLEIVKRMVLEGVMSICEDV